MGSESVLKSSSGSTEFGLLTDNIYETTHMYVKRHIRDSVYIIQGAAI